MRHSILLTWPAGKEADPPAMEFFTVPREATEAYKKTLDSKDHVELWESGLGCVRRHHGATGRINWSAGKTMAEGRAERLKLAAEEEAQALKAERARAEERRKKNEEVTAAALADIKPAKPQKGKPAKPQKAEEPAKLEEAGATT